MNCPYCGSELSEGTVLCPECGREIQVISAVDDLEDEILRELVDEEQHLSPEKTNKSASVEKANERIRKKRMRILIIVLAVVAAAVVVFAVVRVRQNHSPDRLLERAESEYIGREYDDALRDLERLLAMDGEDDNEEALLLAGQVCEALGDYEGAEDYYLRVIALDPNSVPAYEGILKVYDDQGKTDEILALRQGVTNQTILALFDRYMVATPTVSVKGGTFSEYFTVELSTNKKGLTIYYTLDGSVPDSTDFLYTSPIEIDEEGTVTLTAVCMDENGNYSEPVTETYTIEFIPPDMPVAWPDGGTFSEKSTVTVMAPEGTTVYYTWDNTTPTENSLVYTGPIEIPVGNNVLSIIAMDENGLSSSVLKCNYIYYPETTSETLSDTQTQSVKSGDSGSTQEVTSNVTLPVSEPEPEPVTEDEDTMAEQVDEVTEY